MGVAKALLLVPVEVSIPEAAVPMAVVLEPSVVVPVGIQVLFPAPIPPVLSGPVIVFIMAVPATDPLGVVFHSPIRCCCCC